MSLLTLPAPAAAQFHASRYDIPPTSVELEDFAPSTQVVDHGRKRKRVILIPYPEGTETKNSGGNDGESNVDFCAAKRPRIVEQESDFDAENTSPGATEPATEELVIGIDPSVIDSWAHITVVSGLGSVPGLEKEFGTTDRPFSRSKGPSPSPLPENDEEYEVVELELLRTVKP